MLNSNDILRAYINIRENTILVINKNVRLVDFYLISMLNSIRSIGRFAI